MCKNNKNCGFGKFLCGCLVGVGLGILFAPKSGKETREEIKAKFDDVYNKLKEIDKEDVRVYFETKISEIRDELKDLDGEKVLKIAKKKAKDIQDKLDKLVNEAKEKATPIIEEAIESLRVKTIKVLNTTVEKLENKEE